MLKEITVRNLCCFDDKDYKIKFNNLTVVVGTNNSGKSTVFRGLDFLIRNRNRPSPDWRSSYFKTGFRDTVYAKDVHKTIKINAHGDFGNHTILVNNDGIVGSKPTSQSSDTLDNIHYIESKRDNIAYNSHLQASKSSVTPKGRFIIENLAEMYCNHDSRWKELLKWVKKIDPNTTYIKTPLNGNTVSLSTDRINGDDAFDINLHLQGDGVQSAVIIITKIIFAPENSTIIIEEPEAHLHSKSVEVLVDLFNHAASNQNKQIIIITHSWDIINAYLSDIGQGTSRGSEHVLASKENFKLIVFTDKLGSDKIQEYDLSDKTFSDARRYFKQLWG